MRLLLLILLLMIGMSASAQAPPLDEGGVSQELAKWRAARYSNIRYKLNLTLEKMSPVLKGTMEIRVRVAQPSVPGAVATGAVQSFSPSDTPIVLDWRKLPGHEKDSTITNVEVNGTKLVAGPVIWAERPPRYVENFDHLVFDDAVVAGENVIKLDFTSPILTSGSAITRYIDKEDGAEYIYSLFVPSDASTAFPVFDQPDLKAKFTVSTHVPNGWTVISNGLSVSATDGRTLDTNFYETKPISTYVFAFTAGPWLPVPRRNGMGGFVAGRLPEPDITFHVRASQSKKFESHDVEVLRLTREGINYLETYFDYKFPWPKYDLVLIPEFPFGGMEHAGATFLRESSVIFPTEPTKGDYISRANLIFHETAHQWFGDTVTMRWFDDLWLKEGFAEFMAYKTLEKVMPEANAWKVFYERNKQAAYATDSTRGTTPIYQPIKNLSSAKSAYGNIVYRKAPSFLRQAEFYLGEDKFQTAVRAFLKKHAFANADWEDLVGEFEGASQRDLKVWAQKWVTVRGLPRFTDFYLRISEDGTNFVSVGQRGLVEKVLRPMRMQYLVVDKTGKREIFQANFSGERRENNPPDGEHFLLKRDTIPALPADVSYVIPNYGDYGYGIFLLDDKSRDYILKNIQNEKDPFLRSMMWGGLWDSVREAELDPREYVELAIRQIGGSVLETRPSSRQVSSRAVSDRGPLENDESIIQSLLGRVSTATSYYLNDVQRAAIAPRLEAMLLDRLQNAPTPGQRITFFRAFVNNASTEQSRAALKEMLRSNAGFQPAVPAPSSRRPSIRRTLDSRQAGGIATVPLKTKDKFDIVTRLAILNDPDAPGLLAELEKNETSGDARRYAYAARAAFPTAENRAKFWKDFVSNKDISESWIEVAINPFNAISRANLSQPYLERALTELPNLKRTRKIFFINNWLGAWVGGQRDEKALAIVNKFLADHPQLDNDLRLKILENVDVIERAVKIRAKFTGK